MKAIINAKLVTSSQIIEKKVLYYDEKIIRIDANETVACREVIDAKGAYVSPGFVDLHIHGSGGADVMDATPEALETISATLLQTGTTSFLATTMTMSQQQIVDALEAVRKYAKGVSGAQILGVHLEGPFINPKRHGAQDAAYVQPPNDVWLREYADVVRLITLAPEVKGGLSFIRHIRNAFPHIVLSIGHSDARYEQALEGFDAGISHVTHLFNAMPSYHHRQPGIVGACFDREDVTCDIIADLVHTHPHHLRLSWKMKQAQLILITDAMRAGCMCSGTYNLGGQKVEVTQNKALLSDGTLAGSVLKMNDALKHMVQHTEMTLPEAVYSASTAPANKLGLPKGRLTEGYDADLVIFDEDFSIIATIVAGEVRYTRR